jgi:hypothetical protein
MTRRLLWILLLLGCSQLAAAQTLQNLIREDQLRLRTWLEPTEDLVVGQELRLIIEISTRRWFAGGTAIHPPEISNLVILRRNQFATNLSRREEGSTWVVQQWQLELYPQQEGRFLLPPVDLELAVNSAEHGIVRGHLETPAMEFFAEVPELLRTVERWLATPGLEVSQSFDRELKGLLPGDAFERVISLRASHISSMMLPEPRLENIQGLPAYPDNPELRDRSNRGEATAERIERITYIVEEPGQYHLPQQVFHYWDTENQRAASVRLEAVKVDAGQALSRAATTPIEVRIHLRWLLPPLLLLIVALWLKGRRGKTSNPRHYLRAANRALRRGEEEVAMQMLYEWLNREQPGADWLSLRHTAAAASDPDLVSAIEALLEKVYGSAGRSQPGARARLLGMRSRGKSGKAWSGLFGKPELTLNPGSNAAGRKAYARR